MAIDAAAVGAVPGGGDENASPTVLCAGKKPEVSSWVPCPVGVSLSPVGYIVQLPFVGDDFSPALAILCCEESTGCTPRLLCS